MRSLILCFVAAALVAPSSAALPQFVRGSPVSRFQSRTTEKCSANIVGNLECNDCNTLRLCDASKNILAIINCTTAAPYCNNNKCSAVANANATLCPGDSLCPKEDSFYPVPGNCSLYNYCDHEKTPITYECPANYVYDSKTAWCLLRSEANPCYQVDCKLAANQNQLIGFPGNSPFYFFCNTHGKTTLLTCDAREIFNAASYSCAFKCTAEGKFPKNGDCHSYYACYKAATDQFTQMENKCPTATGYNATISRCVAGVTCP